MKHVVKYFLLPDDEALLNRTLNDTMNVVTQNIINPPNKDGTVTVVLVYESYRDDD